MKAKGVSVTDLSEYLDTPKSTVEKYVYNASQPDIFTFRKIAVFLEEDMDDLIDKKK